MKAVVQRVLKASVSVDGEVVSSIGRGLCVLVGLCRDDTVEDLEYIARKILSLRLFPNPNGDKRWDKSAKDLDLEVLCVSQFTLYSVLKGNKLDFHHAMNNTQSAEVYKKFLERLGQLHKPESIKDGVFGAMMAVNIENDGPVTIVLESPSKNKPTSTGGDAGTSGAGVEEVS